MLSLLITMQVFTNDISSRIRREEKGATAVEYGLIVGLIAVVIIVAVTLLGDNLAAMFNNIAGELGGGTTTTTP